MLRYFFVLDVAFAVLGASMFIGVGVTAFLQAWYHATAPELRESTGALLGLTALFLALTLSSAAAAYGIHRKAAWHWAAQLAFALSLVATVLISIQRLAAS